MEKANWYVAGLLLVAISGCSDGARLSIDYPTNQRAFHALNQQCKQAYAAGQNEIQKSLAFNQCNSQRADFANGEKVRGWVGRLTDISTDQGADVVSVTIESTVDGFDVMYSTVSNRVSDFATDSMITPSNPLFNVLAQMKEGDWVTFDASFLTHPEGERGIWEGSLTEEGSMGEPEFNVRFSSIRPYAVGATELAATPSPPPEQTGDKSQEKHSVAESSPNDPWQQVCRESLGSIGVIARKIENLTDDRLTEVCGCIQAKVPDSVEQMRKNRETTIGSDAELAAMDAFEACYASVDGGNDGALQAAMEAADGAVSEANSFGSSSSSMQTVEVSATPSFDCSRASSKTEREICSNTTLARVDVYTASMYRCLLEHSPTEREKLKADQREWLPKRNACGDEVGCIRGAYGEIAEVYMTNAAFDECHSLVAGE